MTDALALPCVFVEPFQAKTIHWIVQHQMFFLKGVQVWLILIIVGLAWWILIRKSNS